jgi:hypothetical protein
MPYVKWHHHTAMRALFFSFFPFVDHTFQRSLIGNKPLNVEFVIITYNGSISNIPQVQIFGGVCILLVFIHI